MNGQFSAQTPAALAPLKTSVGIAYRLFGKGSPIVLMHGSSGSFLHWQRDIALLSSVATVYTPDLPGFGDSIEEVESMGVVLDQAAA